MNMRILGLIGLFVAGLVIVGQMRLAEFEGGPLAPVSDLATPLYVALTIMFAILFIRSGVPLQRLGFGPRFEPVRFLSLALGAVLAVQLVGVLLDPLWIGLFGETRDLGRFEDTVTSPQGLLILLALTWTFAAFGEELAFRIVLMRSTGFALGATRFAWAAALIVQAAVFGFLHAYQGPAGIAGAGVNGLIFGAVTLMARGSIWPAALAHGINNTIGITMLAMQ